MKYIAYHRTSTKEQHLDRGIKELTDYCKVNNFKLHKEKVYTDKNTGKNFNRPAYQILKNEVLEYGDTLIITEIDRLSRNKTETLKELQWLKSQGIRTMILEIPTTCIEYGKYDNGIANMLLETVNNMLIELFACLSEAELSKKEKRQREGMLAMKERGEWHKYGRPRVMKQTDFNLAFKAVKTGNKRPFELMKELNMNKSSFYRYKKEADKYYIAGK
jgi:DNA invertase Pin-like site-specific DNA recombinase